MTYQDIKDRTKLSVDDRIREGIKALLEQVMKEELTEQLQAGPRERTASRNESTTDITNEHLSQRSEKWISYAFRVYGKASS